MNPPEFFIHSGSGFVEMSKRGTDHLILDLTYCFTQTVSASFYHAADRSCCNRNVKYSGKNLMGTFDADCTYGPYSDETFSRYQSGSAQETLFEIGQQIQTDIILCSFGKFLETSKNYSALIKVVEDYILLGFRKF